MDECGWCCTRLVGAWLDALLEWMRRLIGNKVGLGLSLAGGACVVGVVSLLLLHYCCFYNCCFVIVVALLLFLLVLPSWCRCVVVVGLRSWGCDCRWLWRAVVAFGPIDRFCFALFCFVCVIS